MPEEYAVIFIAARRDDQEFSQEFHSVDSFRIK